MGNGDLYRFVQISLLGSDCLSLSFRWVMDTCIVLFPISLLGSGSISLSLLWVMETCIIFFFHIRLGSGNLSLPLVVETCMCVWGRFVAVVASALISLRLWQFVTGGWPTRPGGGSGS